MVVFQAPSCSPPRVESPYLTSSMEAPTSCVLPVYAFFFLQLRPA